MGASQAPPQELEEEGEMASSGNGTLVTRASLGDILEAINVRHDSLERLVMEKFDHMEQMSEERKEQVELAKNELASTLKAEVTRNDRRFNLITGTVLVALLGEAVKFLIR